MWQFWGFVTKDDILLPDSPTFGGGHHAIEMQTTTQGLQPTGPAEVPVMAGITHLTCEFGQLMHGYRISYYLMQPHCQGRGGGIQQRGHLAGLNHWNSDSQNETLWPLGFRWFVMQLKWEKAPAICQAWANSRKIEEQRRPHPYPRRGHRSLGHR